MSQPNMASHSPPHGPPYASPLAIIGGIPTTSIDVPVCAVFLASYMASAAMNMYHHKQNTRRHIKFLPLLLLFGFSMLRILTMSLRISLAGFPHNNQLLLAANIFANAGTLLLYILNLIFAGRILRSERPQWGWNRVLRVSMWFSYGLIVAVLVMVVTCSLIMAYTLNRSTLESCRDVLLFAATYSFLFTILPIPHLIAAFLPVKAKLQVQTDSEPLGLPSASTTQPSVHIKSLLILTSTLPTIILSSFKVGTSYMPSRPATSPAWYDSKASFYCFGFALEVLVVWILTVARVDRLFWVPNGYRGVGDYTWRRREMGDVNGDAIGENREETDGKEKEKE